MPIAKKLISLGLPYPILKRQKNFIQKCWDNWGVKNVSQSNIIKERKKQTNLRIRNVTCPFKCDNVKEKSKQTCLRKYKVPYPMQHPTIADKSSKNSYKCNCFYNLL